MIDRLKKYLPVGINSSDVCRYSLAGYIISFVFSVFWFVKNFTSALNGLYYYNRSGNKVIVENVNMPDFRFIREDCFNLFFIAAVLSFAFLVYNFLYHFTGSKSIYTMLRLRSRKELIIRCVSVPVASVLVIILSTVFLNFVFYLIYIFVVPAGCLLPGWERMWRF